MPRGQIQAGKLRHRITLYAPSEVQDAAGGVDDSQAEALGTVWASVEAVMGREAYAGQQVVAQSQLKIRVRYRAWIKANQTVVWQGRTWQIQAIQNPDGLSHELVLLCIERNDGN